MKQIICLLACVLLFSCKDASEKEKIKTEITQETEELTTEVTEVARFTGQQVTGVTVSDNGRIFVNFPRWREGVKNSVLEVLPNQTYRSYPDSTWNSWELNKKIEENLFIGVQSVVAFEDELFVLDTRNPQFKGVIDAPRVYVFDLATDTLKQTYVFSKDSYHSDSYINDLRVDKKNNVIYFTDSGHAGLVILDRETGLTKRVLDDHQSTSAEQSYLTINGKKWNNTVHSDGIALNTNESRLYYHALTGYSLYSIPTAVLNKEDITSIAEQVKLEAKTAAPDGMIFDNQGNLYYADLENHKIVYRKPDGTIATLLEGDQVKWADTFSIYNGYLYYTNSRIHEVQGDISAMKFSLNKIKLP